MNDLNDKIILKSKPVFDCIKRIFDISASLVAIVVFFLLMVIVAIIIKCDSKGPVLYKSKRVTKDGREFKMYKFRSMKDKADEQLEEVLCNNETCGATFKMENDPRITRFGRFLRRSSIDELPQLFNILKGDMAFVGPRPPLPREVEQYTDYQKQRLLVKQGLTCIWQSSGRSNTTFEQQVEMDLEYVRKRGFWMDLKLILKTVPAVLCGKGAK